MSENLVKLFSHDVTQLAGAQLGAWKLFLLVKQHHGEKEARRIFREWGKEPKKNRLNELKNWALLQRYDAMPDPNVAKLARAIVEMNATLPKDQQLTPRYRPTVTSLDKHLRLLLKRRAAALRNGTWEGPTSMKRLNQLFAEEFAKLRKPGSSSN
jgi:hypothetical protein